MQFQVLGSLEVRRAGSPIEIGGARQRALLAGLLAEAGNVVSIDALTEAVWGARPPADPRNAIQTHVARLREVLGSEAPIVTHHAGYALEVEPQLVDALRFDQLLTEAQRRRDEPAVVTKLLDEALSLWRGEAYAEFSDGPARAEAVRLAERRLVAIEERAAARLALGDATDLVSELAALLVTEPLRERLVGLLMRALATTDRQHEALATYRRYRDRLADETGLEPSAALRDLERQIVQSKLTAPTPEHARPTAPTVPSTTSSLIGRDEDIAAVRALLDRERLVTLTGPGGVGKTRLAAEVAGSLEHDGHEVAWAALASVVDPTAVEHVVAAVLGVDVPGGGPPRRALLDALAARTVVLVLDNCEHVLDTVALLVDELAAQRSAARVLATSRERLAVGGEWVYPVTPLAVEERRDPQGAVRLFLDRAAAAGARLDLPSELPTVVDICRHVDGLPLAIELAAARAGAMTLDDLLSGLRTDAAAATGRRRGTGRHRDLLAVTDWSYRLLEPAEQRLFDRLGGFAASFTSDEAHAVCGDGDRASTVERLAVLVEQSLLAPGEYHGRYRMLRPLRAFARRRLAERGDLEAVAERHARFFIASARQAAGPPLTEDGRRWLELSLDDLRAARDQVRREGDAALLGRLVAALHRFDYWRPGGELLSWAEDALDVAGTDREPTAPQVYAAAAVAAWRRGDLPRARQLAQCGIALGTGPDDPAMATAFEAAGDVATFEGRLADAEQAFREEARLARLGDDPDGEVLGRASAALVLAYAGRTAAAITTADAAFDVAADAGPATRAFARYAQGECRADCAPTVAVSLVTEAAALAAECGAAFVEGVARLTAASLQGRHGDPADAIGSFGELIERWRRSGNWTQQWTTLRNLAELLVRVAADEPAVTIASASTEDKSGSPDFGAESDRLDRALASARARLGAERYDAARAHGRRLRPGEAVEFALATIELLRR